MARERYIHSGASSWQGRGASEHGFTLIELLVSISIFTVIMAGMFAFLFGASMHWNASQDSADMTENARLGLNRMTREIKQAYQIDAAQTTQVSFSVNFSGTAETITYGFTPGTQGSAGTIWRETTASPGQVTLVNDVASVQFIYYGSDYKCDSNNDGVVPFSELQGCSATPMSKITRVDIVLTMSAGGESQQTFVGQAWLRNRPTSS